MMQVDMGRERRARRGEKEGKRRRGKEEGEVEKEGKIWRERRGGEERGRENRRRVKE